MHRLLGLLFIAVGIAGGWMLGAAPQAEPPLDVSPAASWRHYRAQQQFAKQVLHDIPPHPASVAVMLAAASFGTLLAASTHPGRAVAAAVGLRSHPSVHWN